MFTVVLDTCVLVPPTLADTTLRIAESGTFGVRWSAEILDELDRTMARLGATDPQRGHRVAEMRRAFPHAEVRNYDDLGRLARSGVPEFADEFRRHLPLT